MTQGQAPGADPPVLLVHGFASSAEHNWRQPGWLDLLADCGRETIAVDLPGHGTAPRPADPASYDNVEAHVATAIEGREPLDAIGFSAGAHVLLRLAADEPHMFRRLALLGIGRGVLTPADPKPIIAALTGDPDPENVPGMVFAAWPTAWATTATRSSPSCAGRSGRSPKPTWPGSPPRC
jgi:pimeloyl-ACP methyl ester carboxylesterase